MGYDPEFITGTTINLPTLNDRNRDEAWQDGAPIEHTRFSVLFNETRGLALCTAHNVDGASILPQGTIARKDRFRFDPELPRGLQIDNDRGYRNNPWDRGHLVRRRSLHWGDVGEARTADSESFFWSNIAPQHNRLHHGAWGHIEQWMFEKTGEDSQRACIFQGPVFTDVDPVITNAPDEDPIRIPAGFWKIICLKHRGELVAAAFLVWQRDYDRVDPVEFDPVLEQVRITTIEYLTGLGFEDCRSADPLRASMSLSGSSRRRAGDRGDNPAGGAALRVTSSRFVNGVSDIMLP